MSTVVAANHLGESSSVSLLLAGSGSSLQEAASQAASCHPSVSEVTNTILHLSFFLWVLNVCAFLYRYLLLIQIDLSTL